MKLYQFFLISINILITISGPLTEEDKKKLPPLPFLKSKKSKNGETVNKKRTSSSKDKKITEDNTGNKEAYTCSDLKRNQYGLTEICSTSFSEAEKSNCKELYNKLCKSPKNSKKSSLRSKIPSFGRSNSNSKSHTSGTERKNSLSEKKDSSSGSQSPSMRRSNSLFKLKRQFSRQNSTSSESHIFLGSRSNSFAESEGSFGSRRNSFAESESSFGSIRNSLSGSQSSLQSKNSYLSKHSHGSRRNSLVGSQNSLWSRSNSLTGSEDSFGSRRNSLSGSQSSLFSGFNSLSGSQTSLWSGVFPSNSKCSLLSRSNSFSGSQSTLTGSRITLLGSQSTLAGSRNALSASRMTLTDKINSLSRENLNRYKSDIDLRKGTLEHSMDAFTKSYFVWKRVWFDFDSQCLFESTYELFKYNVLTEINLYRTYHFSTCLITNNQLSIYAQTLADKYAIRHKLEFDSQSKFGLLYGHEKIYKAHTLIKRWYDSISSYNFFMASPKSRKSRYFAQLVWAGTRKIGIGVQKDGKHIFLVCLFYPKGNLNGHYRRNVHKFVEQSE